MDLSGCFSTPLPNTSSSSSSSSGVRSLSRKRHASNYLMGTARGPFKSRTLEKSLSPVVPSTSISRWAQVDSQPSDGTFQQVPSLSSPFFMMVYELLYWILYSIRKSYLTYVRFSYYFFVTEVPRVTKLRRIVQKACRYTLIGKTPFRLSVPKVQFLLATLTYMLYI